MTCETLPGRDLIQEVQSLLIATEPFAAIKFPRDAPEDAYQQIADYRVYLGQVQNLKCVRARLILALAERERFGG